MPSRNSIGSVMGRLEPYLDDFAAIATEGVRVYRTYPPNILIEHSKRTAANCIYDHMIMECERRFYDRDDVKLLDIRGLKVWLIGKNQHTVIRWKKMDEDGRSRNYQTKQAEDFDRMEQLPGLPAVPSRVTVGYLLDPAGTSVQRVQVARPNGRRVDWCAAIIPKEARKPGGQMWEEVTQQSRLTG